MAFDKSLDKELFSETTDFEGTRIIVSVFSYNEGPAKLQITRQNLRASDGEYTFTKLGRLSKEETEKILPVVQKALENMN